MITRICKLKIPPFINMKFISGPIWQNLIKHLFRTSTFCIASSCLCCIPSFSSWNFASIILVLISSSFSCWRTRPASSRVELVTVGNEWINRSVSFRAKQLFCNYATYWSFLPQLGRKNVSIQDIISQLKQTRKTWEDIFHCYLTYMTLKLYNWSMTLQRRRQIKQCSVSQFKLSVNVYFFLGTKR